jgi:type II secretory pathway pseudopilin PulG
VATMTVTFDPPAEGERHVLQRIRQHLDHENGFAGIEALIVVGLLGVTLAVAVPSVLGLRSGSADSATRSSLREAMPAADAYFADHKTYAGLDSTDLIRIDPRVSLTVAVTSAKKRSYCLTENVDGKTWSVEGPNPELVSDTSATKGWFEGDTCK